jgi:hypothetical protein
MAEAPCGVAHFGIGVMFLSCAAQVFAQEPSVMLKPNTQVRVWQAANGFTRKEGGVASQHGDTLSVRMMMRAALSSELHSEVITLALSDLDRLEVGFPQPGAGVATPQTVALVASPLLFH